MLKPICVDQESPKMYCVFSLNPIDPMCSKLLDHVDHRIFVQSGITVRLCFFGQDFFFTKYVSYHTQPSDH